MRRKNKIYSYALAAIAVTGMTACSNTLDGFGNGGGVAGNGPSLVRSADVIAWSGTETLGATRANMTRANQNANGNMWASTYRVPSDITTEEREKVVAEFSKVRENWKNQTVVTWDNFFVQQVYKGEATYTDHANNAPFVGSDKMNELMVYCPTEWNDWSKGYEHAGGFNHGSGDQNNGLALFEGMSSAIAEAGKQFAYSNSNSNGAFYYDYIILYIDGAYYVGFDFWSTGRNPNECVDRDWVFNDWIVKIIPGDNVNTDYPVQVMPGDPRYIGPGDDNTTNGDNGEDNGGNDNDGDDNNGGVEETPGTPSNPSTPNIPEHRHANEVEVNLSIQDTHSQYDIEDLVTKLSIHVRYPGDVTVRIPVPTKYFVMADDLNIFEAHYLVLDKYGKDHSSSYIIDGHTVTLTVNYEGVEITNGEPSMIIVVKTDGINQEVIDYLMDKNGDGINFEVWNYYNFKEYDENGKLISAGLKPTAEQIASLKNILDTSFITFEGEKTPDYYINAFNDTEENPQGVKDCTVSPANKYESYEKNKHHLNGSQYNVIYYYVKTPDTWHK